MTFFLSVNMYFRYEEYGYSKYKKTEVCCIFFNNEINSLC